MTPQCMNDTSHASQHCQVETAPLSSLSRLGTLSTPPEPAYASSFMSATQSLSVNAGNLIVPCPLDMVASFFPRSVVKGNKSLHSSSSLVLCKDTVTLAS